MPLYWSRECLSDLDKAAQPCLNREDTIDATITTIYCLYDGFLKTMNPCPNDPPARLSTAEVMTIAKGVKVYLWNGQPSSQWFTETSRARAEFNEQVDRLEDPQRSPILARDILIEEGQVSDKRFIAQVPPPNYQ